MFEEKDGQILSGILLSNSSYYSATFQVLKSHVS